MRRMKICSILAVAAAICIQNVSAQSDAAINTALDWAAYDLAWFDFDLPHGDLDLAQGDLDWAVYDTNQAQAEIDYALAIGSWADLSHYQAEVNQDWFIIDQDQADLNQAGDAAWWWDVSFDWWWE